MYLIVDISMYIVVDMLYRYILYWIFYIDVSYSGYVQIFLNICLSWIFLFAFVLVDFISHIFS